MTTDYDLDYALIFLTFSHNFEIEKVKRQALSTHLLSFTKLKPTLFF